MRFNRSCIIIALAFLATALLLLAAHPLFDVDFGWHLRTGEGIWQRGAVPRTDWFSFTAPDYPWVAHEWLHDLLMFLCFKAAGLLGVRLWFAGMGLLCIWLIIVPAIAAGRDRSVVALVGLVSAIFLMMMHLWRPQLITLCGFLICWNLIEQLQNNRSSKLLPWLPLFFVVWANLHAGFVIGLAVLFAFLVIERARMVLRERLAADSPFAQFAGADSWIALEEWRRLAALTSISVAATLVNPYGFRVYEEVIRTMLDTAGRAVISEWQPPRAGTLTGDLLALTVCAGVAGIAFGRIRLGSTRLLLWLGLLWAAFHTQRHLPFFVFATWIELFRSPDRPLSVLAERIGEGFIVLVVAGALGYHIAAPRLHTDALSRLHRIYPYELAEQFRGHEAACALYHHVNLGGFIEFVNPELRSFVDGRMAHWRRNSRSLLLDAHEVFQGGAGWQEALDRYGVNAAIAPVESGVSRLLTRDPRWRRLPVDHNWSGFVRVGSTCDTSLEPEQQGVASEKAPAHAE